MRRNVRPVAWGSIGVAAVVTLTGCTAGESYAVFDREPQAADALPAAVVAEDESVVDADSARFVGEDGEVSLWLTRPEEPGGVCIVAYRSDEAWLAGCGANVEISGEIGRYAVAPDGSPEPDGMTRIFDNVFVPSD